MYAACQLIGGQRFIHLIKIFVVSFIIDSFSNTLTSNNILCGVKSGNLSFTFDLPIIARFNTVKFADWLVENMNPNMIPNEMLLDVSLSTKKRQKNLILIRLKVYEKKV